MFQLYPVYMIQLLMLNINEGVKLKNWLSYL